MYILDLRFVSSKSRHTIHSVSGHSKILLIQLAFLSNLGSVSHPSPNNSPTPILLSCFSMSNFYTLEVVFFCLFFVLNKYHSLECSSLFSPQFSTLLKIISTAGRQCLSFTRSNYGRGRDWESSKRNIWECQRDGGLSFENATLSTELSTEQKYFFFSHCVPVPSPRPPDLEDTLPFL